MRRFNISKWSIRSLKSEFVSGPCSFIRKLYLWYFLPLQATLTWSLGQTSVKWGLWIQCYVIGAVKHKGDCILIILGTGKYMHLEEQITGTLGQKGHTADTMGHTYPRHMSIPLQKQWVSYTNLIAFLKIEHSAMHSTQDLVNTLDIPTPESPFENLDSYQIQIMWKLIDILQHSTSGQPCIGSTLRVSVNSYYVTNKTHRQPPQSNSEVASN